MADAYWRRIQSAASTSQPKIGFMLFHYHDAELRRHRMRACAKKACAMSRAIHRLVAIALSSLACAVTTSHPASAA